MPTGPRLAARRVLALAATAIVAAPGAAHAAPLAIEVRVGESAAEPNAIRDQFETFLVRNGVLVGEAAVPAVEQFVSRPGNLVVLVSAECPSQDGERATPKRTVTHTGGAQAGKPGRAARPRCCTSSTRYPQGAAGGSCGLWCVIG